jgi:hypothetical protein
MSITAAHLVAPDPATRRSRRPDPRARAAVGAPWIYASIAILVAGCSHPGHEPQAPPTTQVVALPGASNSADPGTGSAEHPFQVGCPSSGGGQETAPAQPEDVGIGPLRYAYAAAWATMPPPSDVKMPDGRYFYKTGAILHPGSVVTVTIAPAALWGAETGSVSRTCRFMVGAWWGRGHPGWLCSGPSSTSSSATSSASWSCWCVVTGARRSRSSRSGIRSPSYAVRCTVPIWAMQTASCWRRCRGCCLVLRGRCSS